MIVEIVLLLLLLSHIADIIRVINNYTQGLSQCCAANTDSDFLDLVNFALVRGGNNDVSLSCF